MRLQRVIIAFLAAPVPPLFTFVLVEHPSGMAAGAWATITYLAVLVFGVPLFLLFRLIGWKAFRHCVLLGTLVGAIMSWVIYELLPVLGAYRDGRMSLGNIFSSLLYIYIDDAENIIELAGLGALAGLTFWFISRPGKRPQPAHD